MDGETNKSKRLHSYSRNKRNRGLIKEQRDIYLDDKVSPSMSKYDNTPHFVMELSKEEFAILKDNCFHVGEVAFTKHSLSSKANMNSVFGTINKGSNIHYDEVDNRLIINMDRSKKRTVLITMDKSECSKCHQDIQVLNTKLNSNCEGSGVVVLMIATKVKKIHKEMVDKRIVWARLIIEMCEYSKKSILDSKMVTHHSSNGKIYSFGYQGVFKQVQNSTVGLYEVRKRFHDDRQIDVENVALTIEDMIGVEMQLATQSIAKIVVHVDKLILPILDIANKMQCDHGDIYLKRTKDACAAMWHTNVCVNATTGEFHTERDTSYTLIMVPTQNYKAQKKDGNKYNFLFKLNDDTLVSLPLTPNLSFLFSATFLTHRQEGSEYADKSKQPFVNLSSYSNHKLFTHIRKSFFRNINK